MTRKKLFSLLILYLLSTQVSRAQDPSEKGLPFITNYLPKNYKALPQTWCVMEDDRGLMYFGVQNGILEYDGVKWRKVIFKNNLPAVVRTMAKDKNGRIYYGAIGDFGYLGKDSIGQTIGISLLNKIPPTLRNFYDIWTIHVADEGIYFQSREMILRLKGENDLKTWKPKANFMYAFYLDENYYVHEQGLGLFKMVNDSLQLIPGSEFLGKERMQVMLPYSLASDDKANEKQYLLGLFYSGLYLFNGKTFSPFSSEATPFLKAGTLYKGSKSTDGKYVLSTTGKGLVIIDGNGKIIQQINRDVGLQDESVYAVFFDSKGSLWLGLDNGISRVETTSPLTQFTNQAGINTSALSLARFEGQLYLGTTNGLMRFNKSTSKFESFPEVPPNQTFTLFKDSNTLLVTNDGLFAVKNGQIKNIQPSIGGNMQLAGLELSTKYPQILYGGSTGGVKVFIRKEASWQFVGTVPGIDEQTWTFSESSDGRLWVGTQNEVAYRITPSFDEKGDPLLKKFHVEKFGAEQGLVSSIGNVYKIKGETWFPADSVLYKFDDSKKRFVPDYTFGHFPNGGGKEEFSVNEDQTGRVLLRMGKETIIATPQSNGQYKLNKITLLPLIDRTFSFFYPENNGIIWIGTTDGLVRFDEKLEKNYDASFKTVLRHVTAGAQTLNANSADSSFETPSISFKNSTLRFEYAAPFFEQEDKTQYQTWLEGFEEGWSGWDNNYYKEYTNLPDGNYKFHVRAKNIYQKQSDEAIYEFSILPPWFRTWWAFLLYGAIALGIIYSLIRWRTRQLQEKHKELEKTVAERTAELSQRVEELAVINSVQDGLVREMDMQGIYEMVGEKIREIFHAQVIDIVTYDSSTNLMLDHYAYEKGDRTLVGTWEPKGFRKHVIETGQLLVINKDLEKKTRDFGGKAIIGELPKSAVFVPLIKANEIKGMISLQDLDKENAFTDYDVRLLTTLANSMTVALESARRFDETNRLLRETEQRNAELAVINRVQESLVAQMNMDAIYELVGEKMRVIFNAQVIDIVTYDSKTNLLEDRYAYEKGDRTLLKPREPKGFRKHVIETGELLIHNKNVEQAIIDFDNQVLIGEIPKSQVYVPMIAGGKVTGIISLQNVDQEHAFSDSDISLLSTLANSMSVALESARLFDETTRLLKETEQRNAELGVINSVQNGLVREMDMEGIYNLVGEKIREIFDAQVIDIVTYDKNLNLIEDRYSYEKGDRTLVAQREPKGFRKHIIETGQAMVLNHDVDKMSLQYGNSVILGETPKSAVLVPMITGGHVTGIISLQNVDHENAFSDSDVRLITTLTNTMSIALESARLFDETKRLLKETEQRSAELSVINSVQDGLAKELDMQAIYDLVGDRIIDVFNAQALIIATLDPETKTEHFKFVIEKGERFYLDSRPYDKLRQHLIETREKILINQSFEKAAAEFGMKVLPGTEHPKSLLFVPLIVGNKVKSYVSLQNVDKENAFSESDVRLLETLANSMSVALENARLFDETTRLLKETEQRNAELAVITSVQESLVAQMDMQGIYDLVGEKMRDIFNAQVIDIVTYDKRTDLIEDRYAYEKGDRTLLGPRAPKGFRKHVIKTSQLLIINKDVDKLRSTYDNTVVVGQAAKSLVLVPMVVGGEVTGVISLQNLDQEDAFSDSDINLLTTLVNSMSVALKSARLFDETIRLLKETEQRTAELAVINSVQQGLAKEMDMQAIYEMVGDRIRELFDAQVVLIATLDPEAGLEHFKYIIEKGKRHYNDFRPLDKLRQHLIQTRQKIVINENYEKAAARFGMKVASGTEQPKSLLFVPLIIGGKITSYVSLQNVDKENAFSESDVRLLETLANSMSVALENARLFDETTRLLKETEQRTAELAVINNVQEGLVREMDTNAIYNLIGDRLCSLFPDTQTLIIRTFDHATGLEHWQYAIEKGIRLNSEPRPFNWANRQLILTKKYMHIKENYIETARRYGGSGVTKGQPPKSAIFVPMIVGDVVKGSVSLQNVDKENAFSDADLRLLTTLTNSMSVTLENARLFDETTLLLAEAKQRANELSTVNNISKALASQLNPDELIELVGDQMKNLFKANIVYLALLNPKNKTIYFPYQFGDNLIPIKLGEGLTSQIILSGEPLLINKDVKELTTQLGVQRIGIPAASYLGVPIPEGDVIIGVLSVQSTEHENRFNENDLRLLSTIAASVGVALRNAKLFEEVKLSKMEAEAASKIAEKANEAKSAFLSTVSHELRTPLTSVLGFAKIIRKRLEDKIFPVVNKSDAKTEKTIHQISENLQVVISEGERLTHLINDVLDLAKIEAGKMEWNFETVSIPEVVERAISATSSLFDQKSLILEKQIENDLPNVSGDHDKLIQVIINLISNAVKFTDKGSVVCSVYREKKELIVSIADTGIGIAPEDFSAVFEQFKQVGGDTLTDKPKGTGLGLPICKEIVDHHGGRIWLESEIGKGSTFYFALPVLEVASIKPINLDELLRQLKDQMAESKFQSTGKDATILIVDDDDSIRSLLQQELSDGGYLIDEATNGRQALEMIRNNRPDLIILDVMMPEMNGFDVAAILKNDPQTMDIPIIVLSIVQDKIRGYRIGVDRYLTKPIDTAQLFMEVGALLEQGKSKKKVMVVDEDSTAIRSLTDVLQAKGYQVVESDGKELVENAIAAQPDIIILNSVHSGKQEIVQALRFEKGLENVLFLLYQ